MLRRMAEARERHKSLVREIEAHDYRYYVLDNPSVYPPADTMAKLFTFAVLPPDVDRNYTRFWTKLKTGK